MIYFLTFKLLGYHMTVERRKIMENSRGQNSLYGIIVTIVLLQIITDIMENTPLLYTLIRLSILFVLFNFLLKGYSWSKWLLSIYLVLVGIGGVVAGWYLIMNRSILQDNLQIGIMSGIIGTLYILSSFMIQTFKNIRRYLVHQQENRKKMTTRNHMANILFYIGIAVIICVETKMLPIALNNIMEQPQLIKKILGGIFLLPVKLPYYAIPGLIVIFISTLINKEHHE